MDEDKRLSPRFLFSEPVVFGQPEQATKGSMARDISLSGLSLKAQSFIPIGTILELQLRLGKSSPKVVWVKGQVVRVREALSEDCYELGLKFIRDEEFIKVISKYIDECKSNQQTK